MFKVGDKVKCVNNKGYESEFTLGKIYEVSDNLSISRGKTNNRGVVIENNYGDFIWTFNHRWELVSPEEGYPPQLNLQIGDKVRVLGGACKGFEYVVAKAERPPYENFLKRDGGWNEIYSDVKYRVLERAKQKENDMFACAISKNTISVFSNGTTLIMDSTNRNFETVKEYLKEGGRDINYLEELFSKEKAISKYLDKEELVKVEHGEVYYNGEVLHGSLVKRILDYQEEGLSTKPLVNFLKNLMENPSYKSREALYNFLEKYNTPLTDDGHFVCWKNVRKDFKDIHSGTFDNSPGSVVEMPREKVDDDSNRTCSAGLHACASVYLNSFYSAGSRTVAVKINPKDVVAVPADYDSAKMRVCRYEVLSEVSREEVAKIENSQYYNYQYYDDSYYDDYGDYY